MCKKEYDEDQFAEGFDDRDIRHAFVRKVFMIVGIQLLITAAICVIFMYVDEVKYFTLKYKFVHWIFVGIAFVLLLVLGCFQKVRRSFPINIILLLAFTLAMGYIVGSLCAIKYPMQVLLAFGITAAVCISLIAFALQTKCDFTGWYPYLMVIVVVLLIMSIVSIFIRNRILMIVICSIGVLLFSIYLIVDVQLMLGGKHKYQMDPEDYVMAAINIYVDIITIFTYILGLVGLVWDE